MTKLFQRLIEKRGFSDVFLHPKYEETLNPNLLPDMEKAITRLKAAIKNEEKILIYGDYDADGITASVLMKEALEMAGAKNIGVMLPDRFKDGYGMSEKVVERVNQEGIGLVITVDCGSGNVKIVDELNGLGVDVVVSDHHECPEELPKAVAIVNAKRKDREAISELKDLAGVGVAFKIAQAMVKEGLLDAGKEKWLLDLVLIGTTCDSMPMTAENRRLCYFGMIVLKKTKRIGLRELMRWARVKKINTDSIGFQIGPRLNAAGRMESAELALDLLLTKSGVEATRLAERLEKLNTERKSMQNEAVKDIKEIGIGKERVIVVAGNWHEGILGIVAGKLAEEYKRPSFVFTRLDGEYKGSGRSLGDFNLAQALCECQNTISSGGGHSGACGVRVPTGQLEKFKIEVNKYYDRLELKDQERFWTFKEDLIVEDLGDFEPEIIDELKQLEPFGIKNEEPVFLLDAVRIAEVRRLGKDEEHLSLSVEDEKGNKMKLIAFYAPKEWFAMAIEDQRVNVWVKLIENEWNGIKTLEGRIEKISLANDEFI